MPYRISYIDTSMLTDAQIKEGILRTEEFPTEPAALARARELLEDLDCKTVLMSDNSGEHLGVVGLPLKPGLTARISPRELPATLSDIFAVNSSAILACRNSRERG